MLDPYTYTRLPQYPRRHHGENGDVLTASVFEEKFKVFHSGVDAWINAGLRRGLWLPIGLIDKPH